MFEGAPRALRWLLVVGWRLGLGLRLDPLTSPQAVLGWPITGREPSRVRLGVTSWALRASIDLSLTDSRAVLVSTVEHRHPAGRVLWALAQPVHRLIVPIVLRRASRVPRRGARR